MVEACYRRHLEARGWTELEARGHRHSRLGWRDPLQMKTSVEVVRCCCEEARWAGSQTWMVRRLRPSEVEVVVRVLVLQLRPTYEKSG